MFIVSRPIRREMKPQKMTGKQQQGSVTTWYETTSWPFFFYKKSSMFPLDLSEKAIFWLQNQHQSLDSVCSKTELPNRPKSECKLWKFTTAKVGVIGEGLKYIWNNSYLYCGCRWKWNVIIAVNFPISAIGKKKPEKNQGFNGIRTRDLRDTGAMLYQLSYEATHWPRSQCVAS